MLVFSTSWGMRTIVLHGSGIVSQIVGGSKEIEYFRHSNFVEEIQHCFFRSEDCCELVKGILKT